MHQLQVGQLYHPNRTRWPEVAEFNFDAAGYELRLFMGSPTPAEVDAVRSAPADLALLDLAGSVWLLYRFEPGVPWGDAPYTWHLVPPDRRAQPEETGPESRALLQVYLVDADTGILRVIRGVTLSPACTRWLVATIRRQMAAPFDEPAHFRAVAQTQTVYRTRDLVRMADVRCRGGE